MPGLDT